MEKLIVDTCVVSYLLKKHPFAKNYLPLLQGKLLGISFISAGELYRWPLERGWGERKTVLYEQALKHYVMLPCDDETCRWWAKIAAIKGHPMPHNDAWIAATALRHNTPLVTHNVKDFEHLEAIGLDLVSRDMAVA